MAYRKFWHRIFLFLDWLPNETKVVSLLYYLNIARVGMGRKNKLIHAFIKTIALTEKSLRYAYLHCWNMKIQDKYCFCFGKDLVSHQKVTIKYSDFIYELF